MTRKIVTLTLNPALDINCGTDHVTSERKLRCDNVRQEPGGGGLNVARAIKNLDGEATPVWTGGGHTGRRLADLLEAQQIDHRQVSIAEETRESFHVYDRSSGDQYRFVLPGPSLSDDELERCLAMVGETVGEGADLVVSGSLPPGVDARIYCRLEQALCDDCRLIMDTSGAALRAVLEVGAYLLKPNLGELAELVQRELQGDAEIIEESRRIIGQGGAQALIVSLGSGGALLVAEDVAEHIRSPTVPIRSKIGAGDSMVAGITLRLAEGKSLLDAARFGVAAGAAAVMTEGTELCRGEDARRLYRSMTA